MSQNLKQKKILLIIIFLIFNFLFFLSEKKEMKIDYYFLNKSIRTTKKKLIKI